MADETQGNKGEQAAQGEQSQQPDPQVEKRAREMGWSPKDKFRGDPTNWVDAETYVKRGEEMLPIVRAENRRMAAELSAVRTELAQSNENIQALMGANQAIARDRAQARKRELNSAIREARSQQNDDRADELQEELDSVNDTLKELGPAQNSNGQGNGQGRQPQQQRIPPEQLAWQQDNPWYGTDVRKTALATGIAQELRADPANQGLTGRAFLDRVSEEVDKIFDSGNSRRSAPSRVEGGSRSTGGGGGSANEKSWNDLPQDAQAACNRFEKTMVGKGKTFADQTAWRKHYITQYFLQ